MSKAQNGSKLGVISTLALSFFASVSVSAQSSKRGTGIVERPNSSVGVSSHSSNHRNQLRSVQVHIPDNTKLPHFLGDVSSVMMSDDMVRDMDAIYAARLREYSLYNGFYATMDMGARPGFRGNIPREEAQLRRDMAKSIQKWMFLRGIPRFFASKPATRKYAETYQTVAQNTKFEVKTESRWEYKTGLNLYQMRAFAQAGKDTLKFEASSALNKKYVLLAANKSFSKGTYTTGATLDVFTKTLNPSVSQNLAPNLSATLGTSLPLGELYILPASVTTISMNYTF